MATAPEENERDAYEGGGGGFGKFRKRPFRRHNTTPYDRPPAAIRNPSSSNSNGGGSNYGWLSRLVDPAQRLIASSAHRLFAYVIRKRLPPPPAPEPSPMEPEASQEARDRDHGAVFSDPLNAQDGDINGCNYPSNSLDKDGVIELEQILKQRTFTRSEIDRLTDLLRSRTVGEHEKRSEAGTSTLGVAQGKKVEFPSTPANENRIESNLIGTPVVNSSVLNEDIASPAEVAKAYMDRRPSKASPAMLNWQSELLREDSTASLNRTLPTKSPIMSLVSRSSTHNGVHENGFVTPRSRGRSAIYNMARTPYSRVHSTAAFKDVGFSGALSSSHGAREQNVASGSKQGALKRRSSVLEYDIGSIGPIRRIRQKSSLLSSKNLGLPAAGNTLSIRETNVGSQAAQSSSLALNLLPADGTNQSFKKKLSENEDNRVPGSSPTAIPSKSSKMASKILQQLDVLVSSRDKSPTKLSPSMLRGPALRSLENVGSSKFLENVQDNKMPVGLHDTSLPDAGERIHQKQDKVEENGTSNMIASSDKLAAIVNGIGTEGLIKGNVPSVRSAASALNTVHPEPQKTRAFQMSAHEDYLDLDEDVHSNGAVSSSMAHGREKLTVSIAESRTIRAEALTMEKPAIHSVGKPFTASVLNENTEKGFSNGPAVIEMPVFTAAPLISMTEQPVLGSLQSTLVSVEATLLNESKCVDSLHDIGDKVSSVKEPNSSSSPFVNGFASPSIVIGSAGLKFNVSSDARPESSSSFALVTAGVSDSGPKVSDLEKSEDTSTLKSGVSFRAHETSHPSVPSTSSSTSAFSVGNPANSGGLNNGSIAHTASSFTSHVQSSISNNVHGQSLSASFTPSFGGWASAAETTAAASASDLFTSATAPPSIPGSIFKFGSSTVASTSVSEVSSTAGLESVDAKTKGTHFGNSAGSSVGTSASISSTGNGIFGGSSAAFTSTGGSIFGGSSAAITSPGSGVFGGSSAAITSTAGSTFGVSSPAISSTESGIFGLSSPAMSSTGSSFFSFSSPAMTNNIFGGTSSSIINTSCNFSGGASAIASSAHNFLGFGAAASSSASTNQSGGSFSSNPGGAEASPGGTGIMTSTQSMPSQFSSSASTPSIQLAGNTNSSSGISLFGSSAGANPFGSGASFGMNPTTMLSEANSISTSSSTTSSLFGSNWQAPKSPNFGTTFSAASSSSTGFAFGAASTNSASMGFGTTAGASSSSIFSFTSAGAVPAPSSQPVFGSNNTGFAFGSSPVVNNDQMTMEDSMAEDTVQATATTAPIFGQQTVTPVSSPFMFGSTPPAGANPFQFGAQPNLAAPQNTTPFQASGSLDFNAGGSFSLGTGGDKSNRRTVRVSRSKNRKK